MRPGTPALKSAGPLAFGPDGVLFVGDKGDNYSNIYDGVGDLGVNGNDKWNYRFNLNLGYYY